MAAASEAAGGRHWASAVHEVGSGSGSGRGRYPERWLRRNTVAELDSSRAKADVWREEAREAMRHAWNGYRANAWGSDQVKPISGRPNRWFGLGLAILESLDTLWLLEMREEFDEAQSWIEQHLRFDAEERTKPESFFEATIRLLGGLLGAHSLSQRPIFLQRAQELGDRLISAWEPGAVLPHGQVDIGANRSSHTSWRGRSYSTAEVGSCQLEFRYLSHHTGNATYRAFADQALAAVLDATAGKGLVATEMTGNRAPLKEHGTTVTMGAHGDSYYEYLLKQHLQTSQVEHRLRDTWLLAMAEMEDRLLRHSEDGNLYLAKEEVGQPVHEFDHLACFVPGMLMLGVHELPEGTFPEHFGDVAAELTRTCVSMYKTASGLAPEVVDFSSGRASVKKGDAFSLLRPETAEALYYMWYYTGEHKYREWAAEILSSLNRSARTPHGFASLKDVRSHADTRTDRCESFFYAETLKYLYLIQADPEVLPLDEFVLNTEAHPLRIWRDA